MNVAPTPSSAEPDVMIIFACPRYGMRAFPISESLAREILARVNGDLALSTAFRTRPRVLNQPHGF